MRSDEKRVSYKIYKAQDLKYQTMEVLTSWKLVQCGIKSNLPLVRSHDEQTISTKGGHRSLNLQIPDVAFPSKWITPPRPLLIHPQASEVIQYRFSP